MAAKERMKIVLDSRRESMSEEEYKKFVTAFYLGATFGEHIEQERVEELKRKQDEAEVNKSYWFVVYNYFNSNLRQGIRSSFLSSEVPLFIVDDITDFLKESHGFKSCVITYFKQIDKATYEANNQTDEI